MEVEKYDLVVVLGSQIKFNSERGITTLAPHTQLKARAAVIALKLGVTEKMIISGGYNFGVRYNDDKLLAKPDFSFSAFARARMTRVSEAIAMADFICYELSLAHMTKLEKFILLEELSATIEENAAFVATMLKRTPTFDGVKKIGILTLLYHMEKALPVFRKAGLNVEPLFAENLLALEGKGNIDEVCTYYRAPRGKKQYDVERIRQLLTEGKSLAEML